MIRLNLGRAVLAVAVLGSAAQCVVAAEAVSPQTQRINELIAQGWKSAEIKKPADRCSDTEFIRRAFIDLIGRIATPEEVIDFEKDTAPNKRSRLIQRLLNKTDYIVKHNGKAVQVLGKPAVDYAEEFAEHWANLWTVWLMTRSGHHTYRERMQMWLEIEFSKGTNHKDMVAKLVTATGKSQENGATNFIMYHLGEKVPAEEAGKLGAFDAVPITSRVTRLFLGLQTQCTQCHDHPFNKEWVQADFWGVNAYFRQTLRDQTPTPAAGRREMVDNPVNVAVSDDQSQNSMGMVLYERRDGKRMASKPIFLKDLAQAEKGETSDKMMTDGKSRRQVMADYLVKHDNFGRAYVNRVWGHLFGRGLNKDATVDDFGSHNEIVHPELINYLAEEFAKYDYNQKMLIEWIATSDAYSLSHVANKEYAAPKYDPYFARMPLKAMAPEVLFESLMVATKADLRTNADERKKLRDAWMSKLVRNFGDDEGNELNFNGTVVQALLMMNGRELNDEIGGTKGGKAQPRPKGGAKKGGKGPTGPAPAGPGAVAQVVTHLGSPPKIYDELFLMALNRHATSMEVAKLEQVRTGHATVKIGAGSSTGTPVAGPGKKPKPKGPPPKATAVAQGAGPTDVAYYQDVFWALLNTNEFILNH